MTPAELLPTVYDALRRLAAAKLASQAPGHTLDATALVHEAWLKIMASPGLASPGREFWDSRFQDRTHFLRTAATAMRQILVDRARAKLAAKRDGGPRVELPDIATPLPDPELLALDDALLKLAAIKPDHAKLLELRYFAGLTGNEAAEVLGISPATADRMGRYAKAWLAVEMRT